MRGKMRAALKINFSLDAMKIGCEATKKTWIFFKKIMIYYFYVSTNCGPFEEGPWTNRNVFNALLLNTAMLGSSGYSLQSNT